MFRKIKFTVILLCIISLFSGCGETTTPEKVQPDDKETQATTESAPAKTPYDKHTGEAKNWEYAKI